MTDREIDLNKLNKENIYGFLDMVKEDIETYIKVHPVKRQNIDIITMIQKFLKNKLK